MKTIILLIYLTAVVNSQFKDTTAFKYKIAGETFYKPHSAITLIVDSLYFDGYFIFEAHQYEDDKFYNFDNTFYQFDMYLLDSLSEIK